MVLEASQNAFKLKLRYMCSTYMMHAAQRSAVRNHGSEAQIVSGNQGCISTRATASFSCEPRINL